MADNAIEERIEEFVAKVTELRNNADCKTERPDKVALMAAKNMAIKNAVLPLTYAGLHGVVDCKGVDPFDVRFWIEAAVGVSYDVGRFAKGWLDAFNEQFFSKVSEVRDLPSPYDLMLPQDISEQFKMMLQTAVACAENRDKVGKTALKKCVGFRAVKNWSESKEWCDTKRFREEGRVISKSSARQGFSCNADRSTMTIDSRETEDLMKRNKDLQDKLTKTQNEIFDIKSELDSAQKEIKRLTNEIEEAKKEIGEKDEQIQRLDCKVSELQSRIQRQAAEYQARLDENQRQNAREDNRMKARYDSIAEVLSPIRKQIEGAREMQMTVDTGKVLLTHINRIFDVLQKNGIGI